MAAAVVSGDPKDVGVGGFPAWPLPLDPTGAGVARSLVKTVFGLLGMPAGLTYDAAVVISELATNAYVHTFGRETSGMSPAAGRPEMWAYLRWGPRPEVVLKVFDSAPWRGPVTEGPSRPPPTAEGGRGLAVVCALTAEHGGQCGVHRTRSRLGVRPVPGKALFLTVPIPPGCLAASLRPPPRTSGEVAEEVYALLTARGLRRLQRSVGHGMTVICVRAGVHVWVREDSISYCVPGRGGVRLGLCDGVEAVEQVVRHCADLDAEGR